MQQFSRETIKRARAQIELKDQLKPNQQEDFPTDQELQSEKKKLKIMFNPLHQDEFLIESAAQHKQEVEEEKVKINPDTQNQEYGKLIDKYKILKTTQMRKTIQFLITQELEHDKMKIFPPHLLAYLRERIYQMYLLGEIGELLEEDNKMDFEAIKDAYFKNYIADCTEVGFFRWGFHDKKEDQNTTTPALSLTVNFFNGELSVKWFAIKAKETICSVKYDQKRAGAVNTIPNKSELGELIWAFVDCEKE